MAICFLDGGLGGIGFRPGPEGSSKVRLPGDVEFA